MMAEPNAAAASGRASRPLSALLRHPFRFRASTPTPPPRAYAQPRSSPSALATSMSLVSQPSAMRASKSTSRLATPNEPPPEAEPPPPLPLTKPYAEFAAVFDKIADTPAASLRLVSPNAKQSLIERAALIDSMPDPPRAPQE
ncbi:hypothetical protein BWQ96_09076 [Gracilariopsis chorda]|uniref:Uncharacterized protein n=1 Tax=Gracilariopsis chorda TaxID=448386 RepID=A0A2V3IGL3_9FLOR|nr:hypothetical protein BWQ96_09076 [Gracilariopsis chorda]|eukprot:PXF41221.1 hypothetical protein BWQ96_09076 [Gracilariopsis chorda]